MINFANFITWDSAVDGRSAAKVARHHGYGELGRIYAKWDDGNKAWDDEAFDEYDPMTEMIW